MRAPSLAPLFRSDQQLRLLGVLFAGAHDEVTIGELAERAGVAQATASREVARLEQHGLVVTQSFGRNRLVSANWELPWAPELSSILMQTVGVLGRLGEVLGGLAGVHDAFVFGSWAARLEGQSGPFPNDVDVVVIGTAPLREIRQACRKVEERLRIDINPIVIDQKTWNTGSPEPFMEHIKEQPLVQIPLQVTHDDRMAG